MSDTYQPSFNQYLEHNRQIKASKLANHLTSRGISHADFQTMDPRLRAHHAVLAGVTEPSDDTWKLTGLTMQAGEQSRHRNAGKDPFEGL